MAFDPFASGLATEDKKSAIVPMQPAAAPFDPFAAGAAAPLDPLDDFNVYNALEDEKEARGYEPGDPGVAGHFWNGVKNIIGESPNAVKGLATVIKSGGVGGASPEGIAMLSQTAGHVLGNYNLIGQGAKTVKTKAVTKAATWGEDNPEVLANLKQISRKASWDFMREARETEQFTGKFNQHLETIFPEALKGFGSIPVDDKAAGGLSMVLDPANFVPAGAAARWTTQAPLRGAVRAAEATVKEASMQVAKATAAREALSTMVKPGLEAAQSRSLREQIVAANKTLAEAAARREQAVKALGTTTSSQRALVDQLANEAASQPMVQRAAAAGTTLAGKGLSVAGRMADRVAQLPEAIAGKLVGAGNTEARTAVADAARTAAGAFGIVPKVAGVGLQKAGANVETFGRLLAEAEGQLPFFKNLSRQTTGLTSWASGLVDQSGLGQVIVPTAKVVGDATRGLPMAAGFGYVGSGGDKNAALESTGGGLVFGLAGGAYGQWQKYANGGLFRQRQLADINRYRNTLPTNEARTHFDKMPGADRAALATMQLAHPDLKIKHEKLGPGKPSFYYAAEDGPVAVINLDTQDGVNAVLAHEIGHHVERHGLSPVVERVLFGDPLREQPGLFSQLDKTGKPVLDLEGRYQRNAVWDRVKNAYNERLKSTSERTGQLLPARDDHAIAKEVFAEHVADYLLGQDNALTKDLQSNVWTRALQGIGDSGLVNSTPALRQVLGKMGVPIAAAGKRVAGSELFPGGLPASKYLRKLIRDYHQQSGSGRAPALQDEAGGTKYTAAELTEHPQVLDQLFDGSDDVARDRNGRVKRDKAGAPVFQTEKEQVAQRKVLSDEISNWLEQNPPAKDAAGADVGRPAGARQEKVVDEKTGKTEEGWLTPALPDALIDKLEQSGKFNPVQIAHLRTASKAIKEGQGGSALFFYQPAIGPKGKYKGLAGDWRTETPYAIFISKKGNVLLRTASREKLMSNAQALVQGGKAGLWENNLGALVKDVDTYLANHAAGKPGAEGLSIEKRDVINHLFGVGTKDTIGDNPLRSSSGRAPIVIRSRRLDRINRMTPVDEKFPTNYDRLNRNMRPEAVPSSWDQVKPGMNFDQVKKLIPKAKDFVPSFFLKGSPEAVNERLKFFIETNPVVMDADGRKILLAAPQNYGGGDSIANRVKHLTTDQEKGIGQGGPRTNFRLDRARLVPAIPKTLSDYHAKLKRGDVELYLRRYGDGTLHLVVVDPQRRVSNHGAVDGSLVTQYPPYSTLRFDGSDLVNVRLAGR